MISTIFMKNQVWEIKFEKPSLKNQVWRTEFLVYVELDFYCLCSLQKSISKFEFSNWIFQIWFFKNKVQMDRAYLSVDKYVRKYILCMYILGKLGGIHKRWYYFARKLISNYRCFLKSLHLKKMIFVNEFIILGLLRGGISKKNFLDQFLLKPFHVL